MIARIIGGFFASLVKGLVTFWGFFKLGKTAAENKVLSNEVEVAKRVVKSQRNRSDSRDKRVRELKSGKRRL